MLDFPEIGHIAAAAARLSLGDKNVLRGFAEPIIDPEGRDAVRVTIVVTPNAEARIDGDALLQTLLQINKKLRQAGEERQSVVYYTTEEELAEIDDPES